MHCAQICAYPKYEPHNIIADSNAEQAQNLYFNTVDEHVVITLNTYDWNT